MSIDEKEVEKFDAMAEKWWDPEGLAKPLHDINPARFEYVVSQIGTHEQNVLDLGCGAGILTESLAKQYSVIGVDASSEMIKAATTHAKNNTVNVQYVCSAIEEFAPNHIEEFDSIICMELVEHVKDPAEFIKTCMECLKPGGKIVVSTINRNPASFLGAIIGAEYILKLLPIGTHQYEKFIKPAELAQMLEEAGCIVEDISGMHYNPFFRTTKINKNALMNYFISATKEN